MSWLSRAAAPSIAVQRWWGAFEISHLSPTIDTFMSLGFVLIVSGKAVRKAPALHGASAASKACQQLVKLLTLSGEVVRASTGTARRIATDALTGCWH
jgi:hypothetical protein